MKKNKIAPYPNEPEAVPAETSQDAVKENDSSLETAQESFSESSTVPARRDPASIIAADATIMKSFKQTIKDLRGIIIKAMMHISPDQSETQKETQRATFNELLDLLECLDKEFKETYNSEALEVLTTLGQSCTNFSLFDVHYRAAPGIALQFISTYNYNICKPQLIFIAGEAIPSLHVNASPLSAVPSLSPNNATLVTAAADANDIAPEEVDCCCCLGNFGFSFFGGGSAGGSS